MSWRFNGASRPASLQGVASVLRVHAPDGAGSHRGEAKIVVRMAALDATNVNHRACVSISAVWNRSDGSMHCKSHEWAARACAGGGRGLRAEGYALGRALSCAGPTLSPRARFAQPLPRTQRPRPSGAPLLREPGRPSRAGPRLLPCTPITDPGEMIADSPFSKRWPLRLGLHLVDVFDSGGRARHLRGLTLLVRR
jgi:hypothetical protein